MGDYQHPLERLMEPVLIDRLRRMPVVVVTGARQTGKSTLIETFSGSEDRTLVSLDSLATLDRARHAPEALVAGPGSLSIDEVQRAPDVLLAVKAAVDADRRPGRFLLTGSANLLLMQSVGESLAGRAAYLALRPLTEREKRADSAPPPWTALCKAADLDAAAAVLSAPRSFDWAQAAIEGGFPPAALSASPGNRTVWFESYVDTYLQRDLRDLAQVGDLGAFHRLMRLASLRTGGLVNASELGRDAGLPRQTTQRWMSLLATSYLATPLPPFAVSRSKRLIKTPRLYMGDTGLGLFLAGIDTTEDLLASPRCGGWLENLILNDLLAWRATLPRKPDVHFMRTAGGQEVDFVVESGNRLLPIEVKMASSLRTRFAHGIEAFCEEHRRNAPFGLVLYDGPTVEQITRHTLAVPLGAVL